MCCYCEIGGNRTGLRSQLSFSDINTEMLSCSPRSENQQESGTECRCYRQAARVTSKGPEFVSCYIFRTLNLRQSFAFSEIIFLLVLASVCVSPSAGTVNCSNYNVMCHHGKCMEGRFPVNRTLTVFCLCDDRWSGPACDVYSCSGRTL